jgi:hypothetical protein
MDFWTMLLPGYLLIILAMVLFFPYILHIPSNAIFTDGINEQSSIPFDIFAAIVFLVAGPAIGFTLSQAVIFFSSTLLFKNKYEFARAYSHLRTQCDEKTRLELDTIDSHITFNSSTGAALMIIGLLLLLQPYFSLTNTLISNDDIWRRTIAFSLAFIGGFLFIISAYYEAVKVRIPLICNLLKEHKFDLPTEHCNQNEK